MEVRSQLQAPAVLTRCKEPRHPLVRDLGGSKKRPWRCKEEKELMALRESNSKFFGCPNRNLVAIQSKVSRHHRYEYIGLCTMSYRVTWYAYIAAQNKHYRLERDFVVLTWPNIALENLLITKCASYEYRLCYARNSHKDRRQKYFVLISLNRFTYFSRGTKHKVSSISCEAPSVY
jgi:hypothetical protein